MTFYDTYPFSLYDSDASLETILQDFDIDSDAIPHVTTVMVLLTDIYPNDVKDVTLQNVITFCNAHEMPLEYAHYTEKTTTRCEYVMKYIIVTIGIERALTAFDKLNMRSIIDMVVSAHIKLPTCMPTCIVNHSLDKNTYTNPNEFFGRCNMYYDDQKDDVDPANMDRVACLHGKYNDSNHFCNDPDSDNIIVAYANGYILCFNDSMQLQGHKRKRRTIEDDDEDHTAQKSDTVTTNANAAQKEPSIFDAAIQNGITLSTIIFDGRCNTDMNKYHHLLQTNKQFANMVQNIVCRNDNENHSSPISDSMLILCKNITVLHADNNNYITTCNPFAHTLTTLSAKGNNCGITNKGLTLCTNIKNIDTSYNTNITSYAPFAQSLRKAILYYHFDKHTFTAKGSPYYDKLIPCTNLETLHVDPYMNTHVLPSLPKSLRIYISIKTSSYYNKMHGNFEQLLGIFRSSSNFDLNVDANIYYTPATFPLQRKLANIFDMIDNPKFATNIRKLSFTNIRKSAEVLSNYDRFAHCKNMTELTINDDANMLAIPAFAQRIRKLHLNAITRLGGLNEQQLFDNSNLEHLYMSRCNIRIVLDRVGHSLKTLCANDCDKMDDECIAACTQLIELGANRVDGITTCAPFAKTLKILSAVSAMHTRVPTQRNHQFGSRTYTVTYIKHGITDDGLKLCTNITRLRADNNISITTCAPFAMSLTILYAENDCGISDNGLTLCKNIKYLSIINNNKITTLNPFANSLQVIHTDNITMLNTNMILCKNLIRCKNALLSPIDIKYLYYEKYPANAETIAKYKNRADALKSNLF